MKNLDILKKEYRKKGFLKINKFFEKSDIISVKKSIKKNINLNKKIIIFIMKKLITNKS